MIIGKEIAITSLKADAIFSYKLNENKESVLVWHDGNSTNITEEQIDTEQARLQTIEDNK